jgi:alpha-tubulin suppressor-like RCC1 family protein
MRIEDPCLLLGNQHISKVSCGGGYCLMLSIFGTIFSMGTNAYGQLGMGHFDSSQSNMAPVEISKITDKGSKFIVDVKATSTGASFAVD